MADKKATIVKVSTLPWVTSFKTMRDALKHVSANMAMIHEKEVAKVLKKVRR